MSKPSAALLAKIRFTILAVMPALLAFAPALSAAKEEPVVHAILFASPTCAHCAKVKEEVLPPLMERYGSRLQIAIISTATQTGHELFLNACMKHGLLRLSVPLLIVGNTAMVGSDEIPAKFPDLIEKNLAAGGIGWPSIPGLAPLLATNPASTQETPETPLAVASAPGAAETRPQEKPSTIGTTSAEDSKPKAQPALTAAPAIPQPPLPASQPPGSAKTPSTLAQPAAKQLPVPSAIPPADTRTTAANSAPPPADRATPSGIIDLTGGMEEMGVIDRIKRDIYGNGLAILVLIGMIVTVLVSPAIIKKAKLAGDSILRPRYDWLIPILILAGLGVAGYLSHIEVQKVEAVCGPLGDCNTVNQSEYAKLFGILPIGILGLIGFIGIFAAWAMRRWGSGRVSLWAAVAVLIITGLGTLFSIYLTFLEPFVIGATCLWCLSSAVIMTTLFVLALKPGSQAWLALRKS